LSRQKLRVLVTGGAGFIGSHVVDRLVATGFDVRVIDDLSTGSLDNIHGHLSSGTVDFVEGDLRNSEVTRKCVHDIDAVVHLAAATGVPFSLANPEVTFQKNVRATKSLLTACVEHDVSKFVFVSSAAVYGVPSYLPVDEKHPTRPLSPYAASKLMAEHSCESIQKKTRLKTITLRLFNVYGPRQRGDDDGCVVAKWVSYVKKNLPLIVFGDGAQTRDFVHVSDVTHAILTVLKDETVDGDVFNVGSGRSTSLNELAKVFLHLANRDLGIVYKEKRESDVPASFADISKATKTFGFEPRIPLEEGLKPLLCGSEDLE
jgi:UDP-glucose 4-epimerase